MSPIHGLFFSVFFPVSMNQGVFFPFPSTNQHTAQGKRAEKLFFVRFETNRCNKNHTQEKKYFSELGVLFASSSRSRGFVLLWCLCFGQFDSIGLVPFLHLLTANTTQHDKQQIIYYGDNGAGERRDGRKETWMGSHSGKGGVCICLLTTVLLSLSLFLFFLCVLDLMEHRTKTTKTIAKLTRTAG